MCGPDFYSMRLTEDFRRYPAEKGIEEAQAIEHGLQEKAAEFSKTGEVVSASLTMCGRTFSVPP